VAEAEFFRLLTRAQQRGGAEKISEEIRDALKARQKILRTKAEKADPSGLLRLANELIVARWLAAKTLRDVSDLEGGQA